MRLSFLTLVLFVTAFEAKAQDNDLERLRDSLDRIYLSATIAGRHIIVDQGGRKALFNAAGRPVTEFIYLDLAPGLDAYFIARTHSQPVLIDSNERIIMHFSADRVEADPGSRSYRGYQHQGATAIQPDGTSIQIVESSQAKTLHSVQVFVDPRTGLQGIRDRDNHVLLPLIYRSISVGEQGLVALRDDTAFVFSLQGTLRYSTRADDARMQPGGVVALRLYGLWGLKDSAGRTIAPFDNWNVDEPAGPYIKAGGKVFNAAGQVLLKDGYNSIYRQPGGWFTVDHPNDDQDEIRDSAFRLVFKPGAYPHSSFVGSRFIHLRRKYSDKTPEIYDRHRGRVSPMRVESELMPDVYVVFTGKERRRALLRGDELLNVPAFTDIYPYGAFFGLKDEGPGGRDFLESRGDRREDQMYTTATKTAVPKLGLLDSQFRVIVPVGASEIRYLSRTLLYAYVPRDSAGYLHSADGRRLMRFRGNVSTNRQHAVVLIGTADEYIVTDTFGAVLYRGKEQPSLLYADARANPQPSLPLMILHDDDRGYSGVYDLKGRQLIPHRYYPVAQKVPGLFSLKADSVYFLNTHAEFMFGKRGFGGRNYHILESYSALLKDGSGKWGVIDSRGRQQLPFEYDSVFTTPTYSQYPMGFVLVKDGRYALLGNTGEIRYPPQSWLPLRLSNNNYVNASNGKSYLIRRGQLIEMTDAEYLRSMNPSLSYLVQPFREVGAGGALPSGIYNVDDKRLAQHYSGFQYHNNRHLILITDSLRKNVSVLDTAGRTVMPFIRNPVTLVLYDSAVLVLNHTGYDALYRYGNQSPARLDIRVDSVFRRPMYVDYRAATMMVKQNEQLSFSTPDGGHGIVNARGTVLFDPQIERVIPGDYTWRIRKAGLWGLYSPDKSVWAHPPAADSIATTRSNVSLIFQKGKQGLFDASYQRYIPPVFDRVYVNDQQDAGFVVVRNQAGFAIADQRGRLISPYMDSIVPEPATIPSLRVLHRGREASLEIAGDGRIRLLEGLEARVKRKGISGHLYPVVVISNGKKQGLYSNEEYRVVLPLEYDAVERIGGAGFIAWKYKADKHQGIDSTLLLDPDGQVLRRIRGGYHPGADNEGALRLLHELSSGLDALKQKLMLEGFLVSSQPREGLLIVTKDGKEGIMDESGTWLLPLSMDDIRTLEDADGYLLGERKLRRKERVALISSEGKQLTRAIYETIQVYSGQIYFRRGSVRGRLDDEGREHVEPWPKVLED